MYLFKAFIYFSLREWIDMNISITKQVVTTGKELASKRKTIVEASTDGLDEIVHNLKSISRIIFTTMNCDATYCTQMDQIKDLYLSLVSIKEDWKDNLDVRLVKFNCFVIHISQSNNFFFIVWCTLYVGFILMYYCIPRDGGLL